MATSPADIIDAIDAAILAMLAGGGAQKITFADGRVIEYTSLDDLRAARTQYSALTNAENSQLRVSSIKYGGTV